MTTPQRGKRAIGPSGRGALVSGAFWLSLGCTVTAATYLTAAPGQRYAVAYGAAIAGLITLVRGLQRWWDASEPFPFAGVILAGSAPPLLVASFAGFAWWRENVHRESRRAAEEARLDKARAALEEIHVAAERKKADEQRSRQHAERIARARELLDTSSSLMVRCNAALDLGSGGAQEAIPDLLGILDRAVEAASVRNCAASALVKLGQTDRALSFYTACASAGTSELRNIAIGGFKEIGPAAASVALPYLAEAMRSSQFAERYIAVDALASLGPSAEPLLREAAQDPDGKIRERASSALASSRH